MKALVFPGQGSQYKGMGKDLYHSFPQAAERMKQADVILGYALSEIMFDGDEEVLRQTKHTQPAIFLHSYIISELVSFEKVGVVAGHSLGEYTALCCAGVMTFEEALYAVYKRGEIMQEVATHEKGSMAAVIGATDESLTNLLAEISKTAVIQAANFNTIGQVVISGEERAIDKAIELGKSFGIKMIKKLNVSGAFHSPLMKRGEEKLSAVLSGIAMKDAKIPVCLNVTAKPETNADAIRKNLVLQLTYPVLWTQSIQSMMEIGVNEYWELGPQKVLQGLIKRIDGKAILSGLDTAEDVVKFIKR